MTKIFESMAMRLPIIMSVPAGESTEIVRAENSGLIVPPENPIKLAEAILKIKNDNNLLSRLSDNSFLAAGKFNRQHLAIKMLSHIEEKLN